jgi:SAM-dependent methyltransferase
MNGEADQTPDIPMRTALKPKACETSDDARDAIRRDFQDYALGIAKWKKIRSGYFSELIRRYRFYVEPGASVLEIGVGTGDLLASLRPLRGVGVDISPEMLAIARSSHPELELHEGSTDSMDAVQGQFDYIILSDLTVHVYDLLAFFKSLHRFCHPRTRLIFNFHSRLWQPVFYVLAALGLHHRRFLTNWVTREDLENLLHLAGCEVVHKDKSTLIPAKIPFISAIANRYLFRLPLIQQLCLTNWIVARPKTSLAAARDLSVSVVCPCRNEAGNIRNIVNRVPSMGKATELIFVEGGSSDGTWDAICDEMASCSRNIRISAFRQTGRGKADAVQLGFSNATGDVLIILDADLTVPPEDLPTVVDILAEGKAEFVNGSRLVYPMNDRAMRFLNMLGNKMFALAFSYVLGQSIKDTLCGTKALTRQDYERVSVGRHYFGDFDPFGDFDLLFGASKLNLRIAELPIRYRERTYGETNISRFRDGLTLARMTWFGVRRFKFI